jgi:hypothetical protein
MDVSRDCIANFCGPRELFELARVCARWRQTPRVDAVARVFHDALLEEPFTQVMAGLLDRRCEYAPPKGQLSVRSTPLVWLRARLSAAFTCARMHDIARFFIVNPSIAQDDTTARRLEMQTIIAAIASCDAECVTEYRHRMSDSGVIFGTIAVESIMREAIIRGVARVSECRKIMDIIFGNHWACFGGSASMLDEVLSCENPCEIVTDYLDCMATGDIIGICDHLPADYREPRYASIRSASLLNMFGVYANTSLVARISPMFARVLVEKRWTMHHIAAQFSRDSPEFARYMVRFNVHLSRRWSQYKCRKERTRHEVRANLANAARNPDARVFEWVFARYNEKKVITAINGKCDIREWNCGEGFRGLQMFVERLERKGMIANFDIPRFWGSLRIDALPVPEAIQCLDFILARHPDIREMCEYGQRARGLFKYALARFGEPMRELLAKYHVAIMYETVL